jgi:uncharacterized protein YjiS (DUF1127 family)
MNQAMHSTHGWRCKIALQIVTLHSYVAPRQDGRSIRDRETRQNRQEQKDPKRSTAMIKTISEKLNAWRRYREAVKELSQLSDRELSDIGIRRGDIEFIVRQSFVAA